MISKQGEKYPDRLREIDEKRQESVIKDNGRKQTFKLSVSSTEQGWKKLKSANKLLKLNDINRSYFIRKVLLELDQNLIDELIRLGVINKND